jgi:hypothetical protein
MTTTREPGKPLVPADATLKILETYRRATDSQVRRGIEWYADAHSIALALDPSNVARAAGILAALSPRTFWLVNVKLAARVYAEGFASGCLTHSARCADAIFGGAHPLDVLHGPKTRAFYATILNPADLTSVVIDRHAMSVALGRSSTDKDVNALSRKGAYEAYADAYRSAARIAGIAPSTMQAIVWLVWRETEAKNAASARREVGDES